MSPAGRRRVVAPVVLLALGAVLVAIGVTQRHRPAPRGLPASFGSVTTQGPATQPGAAVAPGSPTPATVIEPAAPTGLQVSRLGVDAQVVPVGSVGDSIVVPDRPSTVGWWLGGASPGSTVGTTVLVGHVDSAAAGPGALFHLDRLRRGDVLTVSAGPQRVWRYRVTALRSVPKTTGLAGLGLTSASAARLVVITCGGPFDEATRSYADNIVVVAMPSPTVQG